MSQQREPLHLDCHDPRVLAHVRHARGRSIKYLARRYDVALGDWLSCLGTPHERDPTIREVVALELVAVVASEHVGRLERRCIPEAEWGSAGELVEGAVAETHQALAMITEGGEPDGMKPRYDDEDTPAFVLVENALARMSESGKL